MQPCIEELRQVVACLQSTIKSCTSRAKGSTEAEAKGGFVPGDQPQHAPKKKALYIEVALDVKWVLSILRSLNPAPRPFTAAKAISQTMPGFGPI